MVVLLGSVAIVVACYVLVYYFGFKGVRCFTPVKLGGKTAVVTGGNTGIGKATALELAKRGSRVILACRNQKKAEAAVLDIRRESGNNQVVFMQLDLASLQSVRSFAETILKTELRVDILINNAGLMGPGCTEDSFSMAFGVNHLGHFLLTNLFLKRMQQCGPSRIVNVSALLHRLGNIDFSLLASKQDLETSQSIWHNFQDYCNSKLCNVLFTRELANMLECSNVTCYSLHPGIIYTELCRNMSMWQQFLLMPFAKLFFLDPEGGSQTTLYCALQEGIEALSGRYFSNCALQQVGHKGRDDALAKKLWEDGDETAYRQEVERLVHWCSQNHLELNPLKTVEMTVDFRRDPSTLLPLTIRSNTILSTDTFKVLGTTISRDLKWTGHIDSVRKKAQQRLYFLRQFKKFNLPRELRKTFYTAIIQSVLCTSITVWFGSASKQDKHRRQRTIRIPEKIIGINLPSIQDLYLSRTRKHARNISTDPSHPGCSLFELLPSGRRYRARYAKTSRHRDRFFPQAVALMNSHNS
ncbi:dehydrogenase/reductase SDR family member 13-like isoform X4 [Syngnathus typhle]|uniref:dehydrogenase/reductase SDR family member 13-like isoform X4 n=1 Tax=Syngnathus typhle TaxID=161592 RepID=UPI002A69FAC0|nr:dehydrogenase/reductase SDR family member 13-like isoform X4 [Syngnathus typhle]